MAKTVNLKFDRFGQINADAVGFSGTACEDATRTILAGIADEAGSTKKPEYNDMQGLDNSMGLQHTL